MFRKKTRKIKLGNVEVGGDAVITVQSMTNTDTRDVNATVKQILELEQAGCEIIRCAVPDKSSAIALGEIKKQIHIPLVADIHFDYKLALEAINQGVDGLRINPGNIGAEWKVIEVVKSAKEKQIPIRIGINSGSLEKDLLTKYGHPTAEALVESAERHIAILEKLDFHDIKISIKSSDIRTTVSAYRLISQKYDYPLHLGITEAGTMLAGSVKSAIGIGALLLDGIGDTIRVSLTAPPIEEIKVGWQILKFLGLREKGVIIISCPTCGRCEIDLISLANEVETRTLHITKPIKIAVMGCVVNGPGEAMEADIGVAGGRGVGLIFQKGKIVAKVKESELIDELMNRIENLYHERL